MCVFVYVCGRVSLFLEQVLRLPGQFQVAERLIGARFSSPDHIESSSPSSLGSLRHSAQTREQTAPPAAREPSRPQMEASATQLPCLLAVE